MPIGMSRSSSASVASALPRAGDAAIAERMPPSIGPTILSSVQIAATPITPAPKKRTSAAEHRVGQRLGIARSRRCVRIGSKIHQAINKPTSMRHADRQADEMADAEQREG